MNQRFLNELVANEGVLAASLLVACLVNLACLCVYF